MNNFTYDPKSYNKVVGKLIRHHDDEKVDLIDEIDDLNYLIATHILFDEVSEIELKKGFADAISDLATMTRAEFLGTLLSKIQ